MTLVPLDTFLTFYVWQDIQYFGVVHHTWNITTAWSTSTSWSCKVVWWVVSCDNLFLFFIPMLVVVEVTCISSQRASCPDYLDWTNMGFFKCSFFTNWTSGCCNCGWFDICLSSFPYEKCCLVSISKVNIIINVVLCCIQRFNPT